MEISLIVDVQSSRVSVLVDADGTVGSVVDRVLEMLDSKHSKMYEVLHGETLLDPDLPLADTGLCNESLVVLRPKPWRFSTRGKHLRFSKDRLFVGNHASGHSFASVRPLLRGPGVVSITMTAIQLPTEDRFTLGGVWAIGAVHALNHEAGNNTVAQDGGVVFSSRGFVTTGRYHVSKDNDNGRVVTALPDIPVGVRWGSGDVVTFTFDPVEQMAKLFVNNTFAAAARCAEQLPKVQGEDEDEAEYRYMFVVSCYGGVAWDLQNPPRDHPDFQLHDGYDSDADDEEGSLPCIRNPS